MTALGQNKWSVTTFSMHCTVPDKHIKHRHNKSCEQVLRRDRLLNNSLYFGVTLFTIYTQLIHSWNVKYSFFLSENSPKLDHKTNIHSKLNFVILYNFNLCYHCAMSNGTIAYK